jgi:hypothetical protein
LKERLKHYKKSLRQLSYTPVRILPYMNIGRIVRLIDQDLDWGYGISINFHKKEAKKSKSLEKAESAYYFDCMVYIKPRTTNIVPTPAKLNE